MLFTTGTVRHVSQQLTPVKECLLTFFTIPECQHEKPAAKTAVLTWP